MQGSLGNGDVTKSLFIKNLAGCISSFSDIVKDLNSGGEVLFTRRCNWGLISKIIGKEFEPSVIYEKG